MKNYTTSFEYELGPFDVAWTEVSTRLYCLRYTAFWRRWRDNFPRLIIKSKALDVCDACYIYRNYYKCLKKESYEKSDDFIDNDVVTPQSTSNIHSGALSVYPLSQKNI